MKRILIFGGGLNQLTLIKACNDLGYLSIVIDPNKNAPGKSLAHTFEVVAPNDYNKTKNIALKYKIDGIATSQMQNPLRMMAKLASELGFIFNKPEIIEQSLNKYLMKKVFTKNNIPCAKGYLFQSKNKLTPQKLKGLKFPLIIKPLDSHSSRGVYRVDKFEEILEHIDETISFSTTQEFLIEEFLEGPEFSIEAVTYSDETKIVQFTEKMITPPPNVVELGHLQPATFTEEQKDKISEIVISAIKALGLNNTVSHTEIKLTKKGPVIIEIGPRMGGDFISSYLVKHSCGVDLDRATIQMSVGKEPDLNPKNNQYSYIRYLQLIEGMKVEKIKDWKMIMDLPGVVFADVSINKWETVPKITDSAKRPGFVIVEGKSRKKVLDLAETYLNILKEKIILS